MTKAKNTITLPSQQKEKCLQDAKNRVIGAIGKLDNGSHPSSQLEAVDENITSLLVPLWEAATQAERARVRAWIETVISNAEALVLLSTSPTESRNIINNIIEPLGAALDSESSGTV